MPYLYIQTRRNQTTLCHYHEFDIMACHSQGRCQHAYVRLGALRPTTVLAIRSTPCQWHKVDTVHVENFLPSSVNQWKSMKKWSCTHAVNTVGLIGMKCTPFYT